MSETTSFSAGEKEVLKERLGSTVRIVVNETRSQTRNREVARERLLQKVEESLQKRPKRKPTKPTRASKKRRLEDKKRRGDLKRQRRTPRSRDL